MQEEHLSWCCQLVIKVAGLGYYYPFAHIALSFFQKNFKESFQKLLKHYTKHILAGVGLGG